MAYTDILLSEPPPHELGDYLDSDDDDDLDENPDWGGGLSLVKRQSCGSAAKWKTAADVQGWPTPRGPKL